MGAWAAHAVVAWGASVGLAREAAAALAEVAKVVVSEAEVAAAASAAVPLMRMLEAATAVAWPRQCREHSLGMQGWRPQRHRSTGVRRE